MARRTICAFVCLVMLSPPAFAQTGAPEIDPSDVTLTVHVSTEGNDDTGTGSALAPFRTIKRGLAEANTLITSQQTGVRVLIAPGIYLEEDDNALTTLQLSYPSGGHPLVIEGEGWSPGVHTGDVILTGAKPHSGWEANGDGTYTANWPYTLPRLNPAQIGVGPGVHYPEVVGRMERLFVNEAIYFQFEGPSDPNLANLDPGEGAFWIDDESKTITALPPPGTDFANAEIEAIVRGRLIHAWRHSSQSNTPAPLVFRNLVIRRAGEYGLFLQNANGVTIEDSAFIDSRHSNLVVQGRDQTIRRVRVDGAGLTGLKQDGQNLLVEDFQLHDNGRQALISRFLGWAYGGMKVGNGVDVHYRRWEVLRTSGVGVWFDTRCRNVVFEDSLVADGTTAALFIEHNNEVSIPGLGSAPTVTVRRNVIVRHPGLPGVSTGKGIQLAASQNVYIEDNLIADNQRALNFPSDSRGPQSHIVVRRNLIGNTLATHPLYFVEYGTSGWSDPGAAFDTFDSRSNENLYYSPSTAPFLNRNHTAVGFTAWKNSHVNNAHSVHADPEDRAVDSNSVFIQEAYADQALVQIETVSSFQEESGLTVDGFRLRRLAESFAAPLTVTLDSGGTAVPDRDYVPFPSSITIPAGVREVTVPFTSIRNEIVTGLLTVELSVVPDTGYVTTSPTASFFLDDAENPGLQTVSVTALIDTASEEGPIPGRVRFTRTGPTAEPLTVQYILGGDAPPSRFPELTGSLVIPAGSEFADLDVLPLDDGIPQLTQTLTITVDDTAAHIPGEPATASVRILDNDTVLAGEGIILAPGSEPADFPIQLFNPSTSAQTFTVTLPPASTDNYTWRDSTMADGPVYQWVDIHAIPGRSELTELRNQLDRVTFFANGQDGASGGIPLGFYFPFFNGNYSEVWISSNGVLNFGIRGFSPPLNQSLPVPKPTFSTSDFSAHLLPFWDDLRFIASSPASRAYIARPDGQTFILTVENVRHYSSPDRRLTYQVILHANGTIYFNYQYIDIPFELGSTIGLQGTVDEGLPFVQISHNSDYVRSGMSIRLLPADHWLSVNEFEITVPAGESAVLPLTVHPGLLNIGDYATFVTITGSHPDQPAVVLPVNLSISDVAPPLAPGTFTASAAGATTIDLSWSSTPGAEGYHLESSMDGGTTWQFLAEVDAETTTFLAGGFTPGDQPVFRVRSFNTHGFSNASPLSPVELPPASGPIETWWAQHFDRLHPDPEGPSALLADPDEDGIPNLLEYALGRDPFEPSTESTLQSHVTDSGFHVTFFRAAPDLAYEIIGSSDLVTWTRLALNPGNAGELVTFTDTGAADHSLRFYALRVILGETGIHLFADNFEDGLSAFGHAQGQSTPEGFSWSDTPGVGGTPGRVNLIGTGNHRNWLLYGGQNATLNPGSGAITWEPGTEYVARIFFLTGPTLNPYDIFEAGTGFVRNDFSGGFTHHTAGSGVGGGIRQDMLRLYQQGDVVATAPETLTYEPDTWYELVVRVILADATTATRLAATVYGRGTGGTDLRQPLASVEATNVNIGNNGFNAATFFSGFSGGNNTGANLIAIDNWSVFQAD
jgi:hypothetical protein